MKCILWHIETIAEYKKEYSVIFSDILQFFWHLKEPFNFVVKSFAGLELIFPFYIGQPFCLPWLFSFFFVFFFFYLFIYPAMA